MARIEFVHTQLPVSLVVNLVDLLLSQKIAKSKAEAKRLIRQEAVCFADDPNEKMTLWECEVCHGDVLKIGKKNFVKITADNVPIARYEYFLDGETDELREWLETTNLSKKVIDRYVEEWNERKGSAD